MSTTTTKTTTPTFHTCLDHLATLRRALADLESTLSAPHAHHWPTIDPTLHTGPAAWRTEKDDAATYVYGLLNEADPLGNTHTDLVHHLQAWYHRIHETVTALTTYAERTRATYAAADDAVATAAAAAMRAAEGDVNCLGGLGGAMP
ncbi:hypothetical protein ABIA35_001887 [Catenulispora sp. MAP12-49]|uniref:hypothetical protein n=1 Tax=unclassified Catenulispora TaxID=414885 RepID=UPI00351893DE